MSTTPTLLNPWSGDLYAPTWAGIYKQLPGFCDVDFDYSMGNEGDFFFTQALGPSGSGTEFALKIPVNINTDADYLARELFMSPIAGSTVGDSGSINPQDLKVRIRDGDGYAITSDWVTANDLCSPFGPSPLPLRKGGNVTIDLWNQGDGNLVVAGGFKGWKRFPCTDKQAALNPFNVQRKMFCKEWPGVQFEEYEYFFEFANGAGSGFYPPWLMNLSPISPTQIFARVALPTDNDADFLWRGTTGMVMANGGPVTVPDAFFITFYDVDQIALQNQVPHPGIVPSPSGPSADFVMSNGGGRMAPHWPEIFLPRGITVQADLLLQVPDSALSSVSFSLRGFKVYDAGNC